MPLIEKENFTLDILSISSIKQKDIDVIKDKYPIRYKKASNYPEKKDFLRCIGAYILLSRMLGDFNEYDYIYNAFGKPYIKDNKYFNISHSGDYVIVAISDHEIGVDIQEMKLTDTSIKDCVLNPEEIEWMNKDKPLLRLHKLWSQKESVVKLFGKGISMPFKSFNVLPFNNKKSIEVNEETLVNYTLIYEEKYVISVSQFVQK